MIHFNNDPNNGDGEGEGEEENGYPDWEKSCYEYNKEERFSVYGDDEMVTVIPTNQFENIARRFKELSKFVSIVLEKPVEDLKRDEIIEFIRENG